MARQLKVLAAKVCTLPLNITLLPVARYWRTILGRWSRQSEVRSEIANSFHFTPSFLCCFVCLFLPCLLWLSLSLGERGLESSRWWLAIQQPWFPILWSAMDLCSYYRDEPWSGCWKHWALLIWGLHTVSLAVGLYRNCVMMKHMLKTHPPAWTLPPLHRLVWLRRVFCLFVFYFHMPQWFPSVRGGEGNTGNGGTHL